MRKPTRLSIWSLLSLISVSLVYSAPSTTESSPPSTTESSPQPLISSTPALVTVASETLDGETKPKETERVLPKIYDMKVDTNVSNRFATTLITSKVKNLDKSAQEATFSVVLPEKAYISGFVMEIDGKSYEAYVKEKEEAKKTYDQAVASGVAAAHVAVNARDSNRFTVSVNVEPQSKAVFKLTYEELLQRQNEQYELVLNIHPGQPVKNLNVEVHVNESRPLKFVRTPSLRSGNEISKNDEKLDPQADIDLINKTTAVVKFSPDIERQKQLANGLGTKEENGLAGQFIVQYDVERDPKGGEVLIDDGFFVHFFAPTDLPALPKHVVFVLDTSGSMDGIRIKQLKEAMNSILSELKSEDVLNIVDFGFTVKVWDVENVSIAYETGESGPTWYNEPETAVRNRTGQTLPPAVKATTTNIENAKKVVSNLVARGGTDIDSALKVGLEVVQKNKAAEAGAENPHQPIIVFLTDGEPTVGEVNTNKIISTITELNSGQAPIFSLSFGDGADKKFLQKISLKNLGFGRHIYEGADAALQLQEFYKQISSPLLSNVTFKYVSNVTDVTKTNFPILFAGSEIVVSGIIDPGFSPPVVSSWGYKGPIDFIPQVERSVGKLERLWAYLTLKQILEQRDAAENKTGPTEEALKIALKYSFVTDVSSLVVVKPNDTSAVDTEDASNSRPVFDRFAIPLSAGSAMASSDLDSDTDLVDIRYEEEEVDEQDSFTYASIWETVTQSIANIDNITADLPWLIKILKSDQTITISAGAVWGAPSFSAAGGFAAHFDDSPQPKPAYFPVSPGPLLPMLPSTPLTTSITSTTTSASTSSGPLDELRAIPWLFDALNANGTISLSTGAYDLGLNEKIDDHPECKKTYTGEKGVCTLLYDCPEIYPTLTDKNIYEQYFCALNDFAGVCCPSKKKD